MELAAMRGALTGTLRLGALPTALPAASLLTTPFCGRHPRVRVSLESLSSREITHLLGEFGLDAALTYVDDEALRNVRALPPVRGALRGDHSGGRGAGRVGDDRLGTGRRTAVVSALAAYAQPADHGRVLRRRR